MQFNKLFQMLKPRQRKGQLADLALGVIVALVTLFVGLYMISKVSAVAAINNTSDFYTPYTSLVSNTSTIFDVLILVIIIVSLGVAIAVLRGFGGGGGGAGAVTV